MTQTQAATRTRTFSWDDPTAGLAQLVGLSGLEQVQAIIDGRVGAPPVMHLLGMADMTATEGWVEVTMQAQEFHYNPLGSVHGGIMATMLDTAAGCAVHTTLGPGEAYTSLDLTTKFLRPATVASGLLRCEGTVISRGRRTALAQAQLTDSTGRLIAHATSSCLIFRAAEA